jgi:hypothetical protein
MALHDGRVSAVVRAESPQTLELLERHLPELRAVLAERGVETGSVELELASDGRPGERRGHAAAGRRVARVASSPVERVADESRSPSPSRTSIDGSVDTYA